MVLIAVFLGQKQQNSQMMFKQVMRQYLCDLGYARPVYKKPYANWMDTLSYPRGSKIPEFTLFFGEDEQLTLEHISDLLHNVAMQRMAIVGS